MLFCEVAQEGEDFIVVHHPAVAIKRVLHTELVFSAQGITKHEHELVTQIENIGQRDQQVFVSDSYETIHQGMGIVDMLNNVKSDHAIKVPVKCERHDVTDIGDRARRILEKVAAEILGIGGQD